MKNPQIQTNIFIILGNSPLLVYLTAFSLMKNAICSPLGYFRMAFECSLGSIEYAIAIKNNTWTWNKKIQRELQNLWISRSWTVTYKFYKSKISFWRKRKRFSFSHIYPLERIAENRAASKTHSWKLLLHKQSRSLI